MRCVIICAAPNANLGFIKSQIKSDDFIICADGGLEYARKLGIKPDLVVGDFDSYKGEIAEITEKKITLDTHKDETDTLCCINEGIKNGCDTFLLLSALGGRFDHSFANLSLLQYITDKNCRGYIKTENETVTMLKKGVYTFENLKGKTFSLFPFACDKAVVSYKNTEYPLLNGDVQSSTAVGISNVFTDSKSEITIHSGYALLFINEKEQL
ncbi:MAG: thiamine diphosphokinase [Acutalibacteraceae bacterium]